MENYPESQPASDAPADCWKLRDLIAALVLFAATAGVVLWQNAHLVVLWDLSYTLDTAMRIAKGQMPYRDFPLAHAPLTFLLQSAIIRLTGRVFFHHVFYAAAAGGLGTVLAWRIVLHTLRGRVAKWWGISILLAAPLAVLGIYCILPHPSYDCDSALSILAAILALQRLTPDAGASPAELSAKPLPHFLVAGVAVTLPLFFKQNIGLPLVAVTCAALVLLASVRLLRPTRASAGEATARQILAILAGILGSILAAGVLIHFTAGVGNYLHWTIRFATERRMPGLRDMLGVYREPALAWMLPCAAIALVLLTWRPARYLPQRLAGWLAVVLLAAPFLWTLFTLFLYDDADERGDSLLSLWPLLLTLSAALTLWNLRRGLTLRGLLPIVVLAAINGTLLSQQLWGSTYAIWPLLVVLVAEMVVFVERVSQIRLASWHDFNCAEKGTRNRWGSALAQRVPVAPLIAGAFAVTLLLCGGLYMASEERLSYIQMQDGPLQHSALPELKGMAATGEYLANFEELIRFANANIPATDGLILLPGEDPFYFVTGRVPQFPVLLFDPATQPYSPAELAQLARTHNIRWLIVKRDLQIKEDLTPQREATMTALLGEFSPFRALKGYEIYRRK